jgi:hypothetical protein
MTTENLYTPDCIRTYTGKYFNVFEPRKELIDIVDIAHALSNQTRFGGHLPVFYSVAQHSYLCSMYADAGHSFAALMHDASEAYLLDMPKPIKDRLPDYLALEARLMEIIADKYKFEWPLSKQVKDIDREVLELEWESIMLKRAGTVNIEPWGPYRARNEFLQVFKRLKKSA